MAQTTRFHVFYMDIDVVLVGLWFQVFQRRQDGSVDFFRDWSDYEKGFGNVTSEHWLGNEKINRITVQGKYEIRVDLADFNGSVAYATYDHFCLGDANNKYNLILGSYSGNAGELYFMSLWVALDHFGNTVIKRLDYDDTKTYLGLIFVVL